MTKQSGKLCYALIDLYVKFYVGKYNQKPIINRHREKWAMNDVIESVGYDRAKELLEYYFKTGNPGHPLTWFFYNFDRLDEMLSRLEHDAALREKIRQATKARMEEEDEH